ncbi:MAG: hypothetical protein ACLTW9_23505 [Enterocloster sp.]
MVLDFLRDPYSSFRWNPLGETIYDRYQLCQARDRESFQCDTDVRQSGLEPGE